MGAFVEEWNPILQRLRADGFSPIESIKITRAVCQVSLSEAKEIVHHSSAWADSRRDFEDLHDAVAEAVRLQGAAYDASPSPSVWPPAPGSTDSSPSIARNGTTSTSTRRPKRRVGSSPRAAHR